MPSRSRSTSATDLFDEVRSRVVDGPGRLDAHIRRDAAAGGDGPEDARAYVDKVRRHAYKVTDGDIDALRAAGWSEDQIFELTVATAIGAAVTRRERARKAMEG